MTITEILSIIHKERVELEIYEQLHRWLLSDRSELIDRCMEAELTVKAVRKIADETKDVNAIKNLCDNHIEFWNEK